MDAENRILAVGYNGMPRGSDLRCEECLHYRSGGKAGYENCYTIHAELNAYSVVNRAECKGGTIYVTGSMCMSCAKMTINMGIKRVVWDERGCEHRHPEQVAGFLQQHHISVDRWWYART